MSWVVMGVSGSGKSTVGRALAQRTEVAFVDGDDLHPAANLASLRAGRALTDEDRWPWLDAVGRWIASHPGGVVACSALRRSYRDRIRRAAPEVVVVHLEVPEEVLRQRMLTRGDHVMPVSLLPSQVATLEGLFPDERGLTLDATQPVEELVAACQAWSRS